MHASFQLFILITPLPSQASTCQTLCPTSPAVLWQTKSHKPKWPFPTGLHQQLFTVTWFKGELRARVTPIKPHHLHHLLVPDSSMASALTLGPHKLDRVPGMAGSITVPTVPAGLWAHRRHRTCTRRGWVWPLSWSSLAVLTTARAQGHKTTHPSACCTKEQDIAAPLGLSSGARQSPEALAKGGSKSSSASTAHSIPQQLQLKAPVFGELLESTSHHLKANMAGLRTQQDTCRYLAR